MNVSLYLLPELFAVCRLEPDAEIPPWAGSGDFVSITKTPQETSIVCGQSRVPGETRCERNFRILKVQGPLDFSLTGVLASLAGPLAEEGVSLFAVSTFDTDYILVKEETLSRAVEILIRHGHNIFPAE